MVEENRLKIGFIVLFLLFTYQILAFVQDSLVIASRLAMLTSLLITLSLIWRGKKHAVNAALSLLTIQFILPIVLASSIPGYDSWFYIGTAQVIADSGWEAISSISLNASLFPGVQLFGIILSEIVEAPITDIAHIYPLMIKGIVPITIISLYSRWSSKGAQLAVLLLISYPAFITGFPFHHLTHGIVLLLLSLAFLWRWIETGQFRDFFLLLVLWIALLITHQSSTVYWGLFAAVTVAVGALGRYFASTQLRNGFVVLFGAGVAMFGYYLWLAPEYFVVAISFQTRFVAAAPQVSQIVQDQLVALPRTSWVSPQGLGKEGEKNAFAVLFFLATAIVGLFALRRRLLDDGLFAQPWIEFTAYTCMAVLAAIRLAGVVGFSQLGGTSRVLVTALPIGFIAILVTMRQDTSMPIRNGVIAVVLIILLLNVGILPAHYFDNDATEVGKPQLYMTPQWQAGYDWLSHGEAAIVDTQGTIYLKSMMSTEPESSYRPYAGDFSQSNAELLYYQDNFQNYLLIRDAPRSFRIPEKQVIQYNHRLEKVYSNDDSEVYYRN